MPLKHEWREKRYAMRLESIAEIFKHFSPDIIELNADLFAVPKVKPRLRTTPLLTEEKQETAPVLTGGSNRQVLEDRFYSNWQHLGGPVLQREYRFDSIRRWRFDFALVASKIAFEIQGGLYAPQTGHRSQEGVERDMEKLNAAQLAGWHVFQISSKSISDTNLLQKLIDFTTQVT